MVDVLAVQLVSKLSTVRKIVYAAFVVALMIAVTLLMSTTFTWITRQVGVVDGTADMVNIAFDENGKIHAVYHLESVTESNLRYVTDKSGSWNESIITEDTLPGGFGGNFVLDPLEMPHVVFVEKNISKWDLYYAYLLGREWMFVKVDYVVDMVPASIAIDMENNLHVSYSKNSTLYYATNTMGSWQREVVMTRPYANITVGWQTDIEVDSNGRVYIAYTTVGNLTGVASKASGSWSYYNFSQYNRYTYRVSMELDSEGYVHACYHGNLTLSDDMPGIIYVTNRGGSWEYEEVVENNAIDLMRESFIAVDSTDRVHISFTYSPRGMTNEYAGYAVQTADGWDVMMEMIRLRNEAFYSPVVTDLNDHPYIAISKTTPSYYTSAITFAEQVRHGLPMGILSFFVGIVIVVVHKSWAQRKPVYYVYEAEAHTE